MTAWGPEPFQNELATDYLKTIANKEIYPILLENPPFLVSMHRCTYSYDRFRAAAQLMISWDRKNWLASPPGYYELALENIKRIMEDCRWMKMWDDKDKKKSANYIASCQKQMDELQVLGAVNAYHENYAYLSFMKKDAPEFIKVLSVGEPAIPILLDLLGRDWIINTLLFELVDQKDWPLVEEKDRGVFSAINERWHKWGIEKGFLK